MRFDLPYIVRFSAFASLHAAIGLSACMVDEDLRLGGDDGASSGTLTSSNTASSAEASAGTETTSGAASTSSTMTSASTSSTSEQTSSSGRSSESGTIDGADEAGSTAGDSADASTETTTEGSSSTGDLCEDLVAPISSCCWTDASCPQGQRCYDPDCETQRPGRCGAPPPDGCFDDADCGEDERCVGGLLTTCGSQAPDVLGTCEPDCPEDRCHPERCDEVGETCCDPYPNDGPNYCNEGLRCSFDGCEEPVFCGSILCGPDEFCCDRCEDRCQPLTQSASCPEDDRPEAFVCEEAMVPFACGEQTCASIGTQYCGLYTSGDGTMTDVCHDLPASCVGHTSCDCLRRSGAITDDFTCYLGQAGALVIEPPPSP